MRRTMVALFSLALVAPLLSSSVAGASAKSSLEAKLLSVANLPPGWTADHSATSPTTLGGCLSGLKPAPKKGVTEASAEFTTAAQLPDLGEFLSVGPDPIAKFQRFTKIFSDCKSLDFSTGALTFRGTVSPLPLPKVGDRSSAYAIDFEVEGHSLDLDLVVFQAGRVSCLFEYVGLGQPDQATFEGFTTEALDKIEGKPAAPPITV